MQSRNPVQPLLLMFPLGLLAVALILDLATLLGAPAIIGTLAYWNILAALVGGVFGAALDRPRVLILLADMGVLFFFAVLALIRVRSGDRATAPGVFLLELLGFTAALAASWFGGRLGANHSAGMRRATSRPADDSAQRHLAGTSSPRREAT
ncbi:hypothetical protein ACWT_3892 [Actinoplanes sp. SE50]|uniref:DUF2231 domain-containing protein n=1 Tax=unclassified Actinoplanes TaxID=2626549 RepID=UPI00023ED092|nr:MULTISPECIES: hypothetical protein [unclassified Actinoplanes]AEV84916.1 hypothetical protein ACPL_4021 [Actinoplanes sp. SE50/110]ATO83307.1 hypothetical protein ACWT_3892 [Actinoplanes sp. SE50]SLM00714.1 hypothetical protein ACSP50_3947 [Actinoplanes sp. SE50/110]